MRTPCRIDLSAGKLYLENQGLRDWFGVPLLKSLQVPDYDTVPELRIEKNAEHRHVIILNCIDYLYGHALLKLLNAERHLRENPEQGLVLLIQPFLRWLVPQGVAEIWTANIPLHKAQKYYPALDREINEELLRFDRVFSSRALAHPKVFNITDFSGVTKFTPKNDAFRITFIWREDRPWCHNVATRLGLRAPAAEPIILWWQNAKVRSLFRRMRAHFPKVRFTVAGLGVYGSFPGWVEDVRVGSYDEISEVEACKVYAESMQVIGVHGSGMLLPSAHAGCVLDLMPASRWANITQDIVYQEDDPRMASYRYRFLPVSTSVGLLARIAVQQLRGYASFVEVMKTAPTHSYASEEIGR